MIDKLRILFWLGIVMLFLPFFGIPNTWKMILAVLVGIVLITLSFLLRKKYRIMRLHIRTLENAVIEETLHEPLTEPSHIDHE
jgi:low affinity Fe/Cu permease